MKRHPRTGELFASPVVPGTGWPGDQATPETPVATSAAQVTELAAGARDVTELVAPTTVCQACPRLVDWREEVAETRQKSFADQPYWGRPIASSGVEEPEIAVIGLPPSAHGRNRTGRQCTRDPSGHWIFAALHRAGFANQPTSVDAADGLELEHVRMIPAVHCAPPQNKPTPQERDTCAHWLHREVDLVTPNLRVVFTLGSFAWSAALRAARALGWQVPKPQPKFGHGSEAVLHTRDGEPVVLLGCYHVSQRNTQTGALTVEMLDAVLNRAKEIIATD